MILLGLMESVATQLQLDQHTVALAHSLSARVFKKWRPSTRAERKCVEVACLALAAKMDHCGNAKPLLTDVFKSMNTSTRDMVDWEHTCLTYLDWRLLKGSLHDQLGDREVDGGGIRRICRDT